MNVPYEIAIASPRVIRPRDLAERYAQPQKEVLRLAEAGVLFRLAHGYYAIVPERHRRTRWRPSIEGAGLAIAVADYGRDSVAVMGVSAARLAGAIPRALGTAVIAATRQRPDLMTEIGRVCFVTRSVPELDLQRTETELATGWMTTAEQTVLDLCDRPELGDQTPTDVAEAVRRLTASDLNWEQLGQLAKNQRKQPAAVRAARLADVDPPVSTSRPVGDAGLPGAGPRGREG